MENKHNVEGNVGGKEVMLHPKTEVSVCSDCDPVSTQYFDLVKDFIYLFIYFLEESVF